MTNPPTTTNQQATPRGSSRAQGSRVPGPGPDPDVRVAQTNKTDHEWIVEHFEAFTWKGPSGNPAIADLAIVTRDGSVPVVVATERDDNPGVSITNGPEQLAAEVLLRLFPERAGEDQPFRLVEYYRASTFDSTMMEVRFADWRVRNARTPRVGDALEWKALDVRVAAVLAGLA